MKTLIKVVIAVLILHYFGFVTIHFNRIIAMVNSSVYVNEQNPVTQNYPEYPNAE